MKAIPKFDMGIEKWVIDIETDDKEILPVGHIINEELQLFKISEWDTKDSALDWIKSKGLCLK
jgi:hypothetical protein